MKGTEKLRETVVLLIDDDPAVHNLIDFHLEGVVDRVLHAHHPSAGLLMAKDKRPDTILLDLNMPRMNGVEFIKAAKTDPALKSIPIIVLTTSRDHADVTNSYNLSVAGYIVKPVDVDAFVRIVRGIGDYWINIVRLPEHG